MPFLINKATGKEEYYIDVDAGALLKSGSHTAAPGERMNIVDQFGKVSSIDADAFAGYHSGVGSTPAYYEQVAPVVAQQRKEEKYDTLGQEIITGLEGAARGLTFGLSDAALTGLGISDAEAMQARREVNPYISVGSEVAGAIAPAFVTGGSSAAATGAATAGKVATGAARTAELIRAGEAASTVARAGGVAAEVSSLTKAASAARSILSHTPAAYAAKAGQAVTALGNEAGLAARVVTGAAGGAAEAALFGAGQGVSQLALSDEPLSAERIVSVIGSEALAGAKWGGAIGAAVPALGALSSAAGKGYTAAKEMVPDVISKFLPKSTKELETKLQGIKQTLTADLNSAESGLSQSRRLVDDSITDLAGLAAKFNEIPEMSKNYTTLIKQLKRKAADFDKAESAYKLTFNMVDKSGARVAGVNDAVVQKLLNAGGDEAAEYLKVLSKYHATGQELTHAAQKASPYIQKEGAEILSDLALNSIAVESRVGGIKGKIGELKGLAKENTGAVSWNDASNLLAATTVVLPALGIRTEDIPLLNYIPKEILNGLIWGNFALKHINKKLTNDVYKRIASGGEASAVGRASKFASTAIDKVQEGVQGFLKSSVSGAKKVGTVAKKVAMPAPLVVLNNVSFFPPEQKQYKYKTAQEAFKRRVSEIRALSQQQDAIRQNVHNAMGAVPAGLIREAQEVQIRKINFLNSKIPTNPNEGRILPKEWKPSKQDIATFSKYLQAAENPLSILESLKNNSLSAEEVEAVKVIYPRLFSDIQSLIIEQIPELRGKLTYSSRLRLSRLFGVAVDESMEPDFIFAMQSDFEENSPQKSGSGGGMNLPDMESAISDSLTSNKPGMY